jgi:hypothetical protein
MLSDTSSRKEQNNMRDRFFGVEIEHGNPSYGYSMVANMLRDAFPELFVPGHNKLTLSVGCDGSGIEVRTPPLIGIEGFKTLKSLFAYLKRIGGYTAAADGMHVHFDAPEFVANPELVILLAKNWVANENMLRPFVHRRRHDRGSCPSDLLYTRTVYDDGVGDYVARPVIQLMEEAAAAGRDIGAVVANYGGRGALNLANLPGRGTIEVRLHEGTLEYGQAAAWIRFCMAFINATAEGNIIRTCNTPVELLNEVKPHSTARRQLKRRAAGELVYA